MRPPRIRPRLGPTPYVGYRLAIVFEYIEAKWLRVRPPANEHLEGDELVG